LIKGILSEKNVKKCFFPDSFSEKHRQFCRKQLFEAGKTTVDLLFATVTCQEKTFFSWWFSHGVGFGGQ